jgi:hypothetical protein
MAGYSQTTLPKKLGIKDDHLVLLLEAPDGFETTLGELPADVTMVDDIVAAAEYDIILFFTRSRAELQRRFPALKRYLKPAGGLWICWPKKASGVATDLTEDVIREIALKGGLVDVKVCAVDEVWSGLRLVFRLRDRPKK